MIVFLLEAAARATMLGLIAHVALYLSGASNHTQKSVWTAVLLGSVAIPWLHDSAFAPAVPAPHVVETVRLLVTTLPRAHAIPWSKAASVLYWLVTAVFIVRFIAGWVASLRLRNAARKLVEPWTNGLNVRVSESIRSPGTFGATILLPADCFEWSQDKRAAVVAHEAAHVQERDCYVLWLARLYASFFWFNPAAWWLLGRMASLAERTSDAAAIALSGDRLAYAEILLDFSRGEPEGSFVTSMASSNISERVDHIVSMSSNPRRPSMKVRIAAFAALLPVVMLLALPFRNSTLAHADPLSGGDADAQPRIVSYGGLAHLAEYYPADAKKLGIEGAVVLAVTLDSAGRATDTQIISEEPREMGFGAAASSAAHTIEYANPTGHSAQMTFQVRFALVDKPVVAPSNAGPAAQ